MIRFILTKAGSRPGDNVIVIRKGYSGETTWSHEETPSEVDKIMFRHVKSLNSFGLKYCVENRTGVEFEFEKEIKK